MPPRRDKSPDGDAIPPNRPIVTRAASRTMNRGGGSSAQSSRPSSSAAQSSSTPLAPTTASRARHINAPSPVQAPFGAAVPRKPTAPEKGKGRKVTMEEVPDVEDPAPAIGQMSAFRANTSAVAGPSNRSTSRSSGTESPIRPSPAKAPAKPLPPSDPSSMESSLETFTSERTKEGTSAPPRDPPPHFESESVTVALSQRSRSEMEERERYPRFFKGTGAVIDLYREPLSSSVERYHDVFEPDDHSQDDPLLYFGAEDGLLPGADEEKSQALRDAVVRYQYPHRNFLWNDLSDAISRVYALSAGELELVSRVDQTDQRTYYSLDLGELELVAQTVVAVQQILDALGDFLGRRPASRFVVDPKFTFLLMLENARTTRSYASPLLPYNYALIEPMLI
ncbi:hypothetical protein B0H13DRAFT_2342324 [Mycena leptocephala]|nr:hypothetical protein B0H13DRAFT_2342324 [Mycena leptocephala]